MKPNWTFLGGEGYKTKNLPWGMGGTDIFWNYKITLWPSWPVETKNVT